MLVNFLNIYTSTLTINFWRVLPQPILERTRWFFKVLLVGARTKMTLQNRHGRREQAWVMLLLWTCRCPNNTGAGHFVRLFRFTTTSLVQLKGYQPLLMSSSMESNLIFVFFSRCFLLASFDIIGRISSLQWCGKVKEYAGNSFWSLP